jgi:hypothetical protein
MHPGEHADLNQARIGNALGDADLALLGVASAVTFGSSLASVGPWHRFLASKLTRKRVWRR